MKIAEYYEKKEHQGVQCSLCPHRCFIKNNESGRCGVRRNEEGVLTAVTYGQISSYGVDSIEKKPLFHYFPGKKIASFGSYGCNFSCQFCQNYSISQEVGRGILITPQALIEKGMEDPESIGIAATYNEPTIQFEFLMDLFEVNRARGRKNVMVSNGYIEPSPLSELVTLVDAFNIDIKGFSNHFYQKICGGTLDPVLRTIDYIFDRSHLELTFLMIPGLNDDPKELEGLFKQIASISPDIPIHISRYFPSYQMNRPPTRYEEMIKAMEMAKSQLNYVYIGNVPEHLNETKCRSCGHTLIERCFGSTEVFFQEERCPSCGRFHHIHID